MRPALWNKLVQKRKCMSWKMRSSQEEENAGERCVNPMSVIDWTSGSTKEMCGIVKHASGMTDKQETAVLMCHTLNCSAHEGMCGQMELASIMRDMQATAVFIHTLLLFIASPTTKAISGL